MNLTDEQATALKALSAFVLGGSSIFILKGYAGTGKTTLLKSLIDILPRLAQDRPYFVFAPTGRAAKILHDKTGCGSTIHKGIYVRASETINYSENENLELVVDTKNQDNKIVFEINTLFRRSRPIVIVDEASMITNVVDHPSQFFVNYYFFSSAYHKVQFYYGSSGDVTAAIPSTIGKTDDPSLVQFLRSLDESRQSASSICSA